MRMPPVPPRLYDRRSSGTPPDLRNGHDIGPSSLTRTRSESAVPLLIRHGCRVHVVPATWMWHPCRFGGARAGGGPESPVARMSLERRDTKDHTPIHLSANDQKKQSGIATVPVRRRVMAESPSGNGSGWARAIGGHGEQPSLVVSEMISRPSPRPGSSWPSRWAWPGSASGGSAAACPDGIPSVRPSPAVAGEAGQHSPARG